MYSYEFDVETGGIKLLPTPLNFSKEPRPVYYKELDLLGFDEKWVYEKDDSSPYMWAEANVYYYRGRKVFKTRGGSLYTKPVIEYLDEPEPNGAPLRFVDIKKMVENNKQIMDALTNTAIKWVYNKYEEYKNKVDVFYVAFSGGKDSLVIFDIVRKALPVEKYKVVFGDTQMECKDTYHVVDEIEKQCKKENIEFLKTKSRLEVKKSWELFGPPARALRWCCSVHKTAPQILILRKILNKKNFKGFAFVGIRGDESDSRNNYEPTSYSKKHSGQYSAYPILDWGSAEVYLYLFLHNIKISDAYKAGNTRVGCICCPETSQRKEYFAYECYKHDFNKYTQIIEKRLCSNMTDDRKRNYFEVGGWKVRNNGMSLSNNISRYNELITEKELVIEIIEPRSNWREWLKTLGEFSYEKNIITLTSMGAEYVLSLIETDNGYKIWVPLDIVKKMPLFIKNLKIVFRKASYCINCGECEANCVHGALHFSTESIHITNCLHCGSCQNIPGGCLLYYTNRLAKGEKNFMTKSINSYAAHGPRLDWIDSFFRYNGDFSQGVSLGSVQVPMFKRFLRDAELLIGDKFSDFSKTIKHIGLNDNRAWELMLVNLAYSSEIGWYIKNIMPNHTYSRDNFVALIEEQGINHDSASVICTAFKLILKLPFGKNCGLGSMLFKDDSERNIISLTRGSCHTLSSEVVLYSLYRFAEACDGYYQFSLNRLMDFSVESSGISPAQIFCLAEETLKKILSGLSATRPDYINYSETHGMQTISLRKNMTAKAVLELF
ncbi:MAG: DUF4007 family protein [Christensenellaceae bacterium]|jgi:phosphoadenosine phosphosulfate reductase|nr:DUF4007 family protein [Christensenellaceae bacterium]